MAPEPPGPGTTFAAMDAMEDEQPVSERVERSPLGQVLISALVVVLILVEVGTNLPSSAIARSVGPTSIRIVRLLGFEQAWGVFSPDPRPTSLQFEARVTFADGTQTIWHVPSGDPVVSNLRYYRWRKWVERVRADDYKDIWDPTAHWIASLYAHDRSPVTTVELIRRFHDNTMLNPQPPWQEFVYYTLHLPVTAR
jgi:hypothetical protein